MSFFFRGSLTTSLFLNTATHTTDRQNLTFNEQYLKFSKILLFFSIFILEYQPTLISRQIFNIFFKNISSIFWNILWKKKNHSCLIIFQAGNPLLHLKNQKKVMDGLRFQLLHGFLFHFFLHYLSKNLLNQSIHHSFFTASLQPAIHPFIQVRNIWNQVKLPSG